MTHVRIPPANVAVHLEGVCKRYGAVTALHPVSLTLYEGEFVSLLGPVGCGKSTLLKLLAGSLETDAGEVVIDGQPLAQSARAPYEVGVVAQDYALQTALSVAQNVGEPLRVRGVAAAEIEQQVQQALAQVQLQGCGHCYPHELSAGQQQRVALACALVLRPRLLLLDEPFSALDKPLRLAMQAELKDLQRKLGITLLLVTHDHRQALGLSDRVVVIDAGRVRQVGTPEAIYRDPQHPRVAGFVGDVNVLPGRYLSRDERALLELGNSPLRLAPARVHGEVGARVDVYVRPENIQLGPLGPQSLFSATVVAHVFQGDHLDIHLDVPALGQKRLFVRQSGLDALTRWPTGAVAGLTFDCEAVCAFAADSY